MRSEGFVSMPLEVAARQVERITVVDVSGNLWPRTDKGGHVLSEFVQDLAEKGSKQILLNLKGVRQHDNSGVGELVACLKAMRAQQGQLKLANMSQTLNARLAFARLSKIFEIYEDEASAIKAFGSPS
jgi:anti-sigma B factor antagonist